MHRGSDQFVVRMEGGMRERVRIRALANRRSMNAEINHYIDQGLARDDESSASVGALPSRGSENPREGKSNERDGI